MNLIVFYKHIEIESDFETGKPFLEDNIYHLKKVQYLVHLLNTVYYIRPRFFFKVILYDAR